MGHARRWLARLLLAAAGLALIVLFAGWQLLRASLPLLDGELQHVELRAGASLERDASGIVTVRAGNRLDLAFATGLAHGQDRFFQMDLSRRSAAGELAALVGAAALPLDRRARLHRFRARAEARLATLPDADIELLEAYTAGVNAALAQPAARPFEYMVLRTAPEPWQPADSLLVVFAMFIDLNDEDAARDLGRGYAARVLPTDVFAWLYPKGSEWDAALDGTRVPGVPVPPAESYDLRGYHQSLATVRTPDVELLAGSNNWAVGGALSHSGRAIVVNDMHLGLRVPAVFYRVRLVQDGAGGFDISGVSLPGAPVVVAGSNGHIAWSFTNSNGDWSDAVIVRPGTSDERYRVPGGERDFTKYREVLEVRGGASEELIVRETAWGPVRSDAWHPEGDIAVRWIAHADGAVNIVQRELETATSVEDALGIAARAGIPPQNFVVGDAAGNIAWTIAGRIPRRDGSDTWLPIDGSVTSDAVAWLDAADYPVIRNPTDGRLWTANARVVNGEALAKIGFGGYALGARARQIRDGLYATDRFEPVDMLRVQLDDRALFLQRWRDLLLATLDDTAVGNDESRRQLRQLVSDWIPRASVDSTGYRLVRAFRDEVRALAFDMLMLPVREAYPHEVDLVPSRQFEAPLWSLVEQRPAHLLSDNYANWRAFLLTALDRATDKLDGLPGTLAERTWGERNTAALRHPLSRSLPWVSRWLDMPREPLPGDSHMPRVQGPAFGASERFGVSPGDEGNGYLHLPAGQSGHPLSPFYAAGHADWVDGRASPFLPGPARHRLTLVPPGGLYP